VSFCKKIYPNRPRVNSAKPKVNSSRTAQSWAKPSFALSPTSPQETQAFGQSATVLGSGKTIENSSNRSRFGMDQDHEVPQKIPKIRGCLLPSKFQKFYKILRHIESLDTCMKY
jgi:hypothetical protein